MYDIGLVEHRLELAWHCEAVSKSSPGMKRVPAQTSLPTYGSSSSVIQNVWRGEPYVERREVGT